MKKVQTPAVPAISAVKPSGHGKGKRFVDAVKADFFLADASRPRISIALDATTHAILGRSMST